MLRAVLYSAPLWTPRPSPAVPSRLWAEPVTCPRGRLYLSHFTARELRATGTSEVVKDPCWFYMEKSKPKRQRSVHHPLGVMCKFTENV